MICVTKGIEALDFRGFFERVRSGCETENEYFVELLRVRGFALETVKDALYLSDNSFKEDYAFLSDLLTRFGCGSIEGKKLILNDNAKGELLEELFTDEPPIEGGFSGGGAGSGFRHRVHDTNVPVALIDPFIACYVKAISACSVRVKASCDGNHPRLSKMLIMIDDNISRIWHRLIFEKRLAGKYYIKWNGDCTAVEFNHETKYETYYELYTAARELYSMRKEIRDILNKALREIPPELFRSASEAEIEGAFIQNATQLFDTGATYYIGAETKKLKA